MTDKIKAVSIDPAAGGVGVSIDEQGIHVDMANLVDKTVVAGSDYIIIYDPTNGVRRVSRDILLGNTGAIVIRGSVTLVEDENYGTIAGGARIERGVAPVEGNGTAYVISTDVARNSITGSADDDYDSFLANNLVMWYAPNWQPVRINTGAVTSCFGRTGDVAAQLGDYSAALVTTTTSNANIQEDIDGINTTVGNHAQSISGNTQTNETQQTAIDSLNSAEALTGEPV